MRKPDYDRRVVVTGLGVISPVGNDVDDRLGQPRQRRVRPRRRSPSSTPRRTRPSSAGEVRDFDAADWMDAKAARRSESSMHFGVAAAKQALADSGFEITDENRDRGRRRLRLRRRRPDADDRQLRSSLHERGPAHASRRRSSPTPSSTAARG